MPIIDAGDIELLGKEAEFSKSAIPGSKRLVREVVAATNTSNCCIMGNHGILVYADSISAALERCRAMERAARRYIEVCIEKTTKK